MTSASLFAGFEGAGEGFHMAGFTHTWGLEIDPKIAEVANANGHHVTTQDILTANPKQFDKPNLLHASPPCITASVANKNSGETPLDLELAKKICEFIRVLQPDFFTLENVIGYRKYKSFALIQHELSNLGYFYSYDHLNAADFGVPQNRHRLILRASRGFLPALPEPTPHIGWYDAVQDIIHIFEDSQLAQWQIDRLEATGLIGTLLCNAAGTESHPKPAGEPAFTVTASDSQASRILIGQGSLSPLTQEAESSPTVTANHNQANLRVLAIAGQTSTGKEGRQAQTAGAHSPIWTMSASDSKRPIRLLLEHCQVKRVSPHGVKRFQSFRDTYQLPEGKGTIQLNSKGLGNAVPPLMAKSFTQGFNQ